MGERAANDRAMRSVCVFLSAGALDRPELVAMAEEMGTELARRGITLVYGGTDHGLMGRMARAALRAGGRVKAITPRGLVRPGDALRHIAIDCNVVDLDRAHEYPVGDIHARLEMFGHLSDAFIALPGGIGTMEELFMALRALQLKDFRPAKPVGIMDAPLYAPLFELLDGMVKAGTLRPEHRALLTAAPTVAGLLDALEVQVHQAQHAEERRFHRQELAHNRRNAVASPDGAAVDL